ncbi:MAG TPA: hypothetical protein VN634_09125 [Candidatus Limnocylindrales bacterium]|nr:hypothetical protein [Candidatus Limnocylindrales bacterium]
MITSLRTRRAVFWYLAPDRIVAAVVSRAEREPVLEACAASYAPPVAGSCFAPGVIEVAWVLGCERDPHIAALAAPFCRVDSAASGQAPVDDDLECEEAENVEPNARYGEALPQRAERLAAVTGAQDGTRVWAQEGAVAQAAAVFRRARLRLIALDCEPCVLLSLSAALGTGDVLGARRQHLSAVSVLPESEAAAEALGEDLAVPVGLAVSWFGAGRAR